MAERSGERWRSSASLLTNVSRPTVVGPDGLVVVYLVTQPRGVLPIRIQKTSEPRAHSISELLVCCDQALPMTILSNP